MKTAPASPTEPNDPDRRSRKRAARREALLDLADELIERDGVAGFTMASLAQAADYAPASLYTYFPSRSALFAQLQQRALGTLTEVAVEHVVLWDGHLAASVANRRERALARVIAYADLFLTSPQHHSREMRLQQELLMATGVEDLEDAASVVPSAMETLDVPRGLLAEAAEAEALTASEDPDPISEAFGADLVRTFSLVVALNGSLMVDSLIAGQPATGVVLGQSLTRTLLSGWGAKPKPLGRARELAAELASLDDSCVRDCVRG